MKQPTEAQIKEFWEWCGFKVGGDGETHYWLDHDNSPTDIALSSTDLNALFK